MSAHIPVHLVFEDKLTEMVLERILRDVPDLLISQRYTGRGEGYIKKNMAAFNHAARVIPFIVVLDLDDEGCPVEKKERLLSVPRHPNLLVRVAVKETEAWLLADRLNLAAFLGISEAIIPRNVENIADPKETLINLARRSPKRATRDALVPLSGSTAKVGRGYNDCLTSFVSEHWDIEAACMESRSLHRAIKEIQNLPLSRLGPRT